MWWQLSASEESLLISCQGAACRHSVTPSHGNELSCTLCTEDYRQSLSPQKWTPQISSQPCIIATDAPARFHPQKEGGNCRLSGSICFLLISLTAEGFRWRLCAPSRHLAEVNSTLRRLPSIFGGSRTELKNKCVWTLWFKIQIYYLVVFIKHLPPQ